MPQVPSRRTEQGQFLRQSRLRCGQSQLAVAEHLGVTLRAVKYWEAGLRTPRLHTLIFLTGFLELNTQELIRWRRLRLGLPADSAVGFQDIETETEQPDMEA